jgi:hypothetical protein
MLCSPFSPLYISFPYLPSVYPHFLMSSDLPIGPQGALIRAISWTLSLLHVLPPPSGQAVVCPPFSYWLPCPHPIFTLFLTGLIKVLPWLTGSYISNQFLMHSLLIALMMEAARTFETLVNFYQTTWRCNPEDGHLHTHCCENLKS